MIRIISVLIWSIVISLGDSQNTRVVYIGEIPLLVAGPPASATTTPASTSPEATTPAAPSAQEDNVTETLDDEDEVKTDLTTPVVCFIAFVLLHAIA